MEMEEYLAHYGIKGMRWGRRKAKNTSDDHKRIAAIRKKHISEMSNSELKEAVNRMQQEQQYGQLSSQLKAAGRSKTTNTLKAIGKVTAKSLAVAGVLGGAAAIAKKFNLNQDQASGLEKAMKVVSILVK